MKGGDVVMVLALKALKAAGALDALNITVVMTGDDKPRAGRCRPRVPRSVEAATGAAVAMGFEDGDGDPTHAVIARRGTTGWIVRTSGPSGHSTQILP
jgi:glutamate carboxypeptidase